MLRLAVKILLALSLLMQGGVVALAAEVASAQAHCPHGMQHDAHAKAPCCPECDTSTALSGCPACAMAMIAVLPHAGVSIEPVRLHGQDGATPLLHGHTLPPTRPPIA